MSPYPDYLFNNLTDFHNLRHLQNKHSFTEYEYVLMTSYPQYAFHRIYQLALGLMLSRM